MSLSVSGSNPRNEIVFIPFLSQDFVRDQEWYKKKKKTHLCSFFSLWSRWSNHSLTSALATVFLRVKSHISAVRDLLIQHHMILNLFFCCCCCCCSPIKFLFAFKTVLISLAKYFLPWILVWPLILWDMSCESLVTWITSWSNNWGINGDGSTWQ